MVVLPPDPYKILNVPQDAQLPDIRAAHRKLVKLCHPDKVAADATDYERKSKEDEFKRVQKAYELLSDENERRKYEDQLRLFKRLQQLRTAATATNAFSTPPRRADSYHAESTSHRDADIHNTEPRPSTFSSRSPPKDSPEPRHRPSRDFDDIGRNRPNVRVPRAPAEPQRARRSPSYESHPSPTDETNTRSQLEQEKDKVRRLQRALEAEKKAKEKAKADAKAARKEEKSSRKSSTKEPYLEEPNRGSDETFVAKSATKSKPAKSSSHKHRTSKHDRSRSRSAQGRPDKPVKKKESREKSHLRPEVEEADDTDPGVDSGQDEIQRKIKERESYINQQRKYAPGPPNLPNAPTPPPMTAAKPPPPGPPPGMDAGDRDRGVPILGTSPPHGPRHAPTSPTENHPVHGHSSHPRLSRASTAPQPQTYTTRSIPISENVPYSGRFQDSPNSGRGRSRSRLQQQYFPEDEEADERGTPRTRRGSSNAYVQQQSYSGRPAVYVEPGSAQYYDQQQYYQSSSSPKYSSHMANMGSVRIPPSSGAPFTKVNMGRPYEYRDVNYSSVPHGGSPHPYAADSSTAYVG